MPIPTPATAEVRQETIAQLLPRRLLLCDSDRLLDCARNDVGVPFGRNLVVPDERSPGTLDPPTNLNPASAPNVLVHRSLLGPGVAAA